MDSNGFSNNYAGGFSNIPLGLGIPLAMNDGVREGFEHLSETEKEHVILRCKDAKTKNEMDRILDGLSPEDRDEINSVFQGLGLDLKIIGMTVGKVLKRSGTLSGAEQTVADFDVYRKGQREKNF